MRSFSHIVLTLSLSACVAFAAAATSLPAAGGDVIVVVADRDSFYEYRVSLMHDAVGLSGTAAKSSYTPNAAAMRRKSRRVDTTPGAPKADGGDTESASIFSKPQFAHLFPAGRPHSYAPTERSLNRAFVATVTGDEFDPRTRVGIVVLDLQREAVALSKRFDPDVVADLTWSPDSQWLAVLLKSTRTGLWPWELLSLVAGHPIPHNRFSVEILEIRGAGLKKYAIPKSVTHGAGSVLWPDRN